jgi:hypothetical protein
MMLTGFVADLGALKEELTEALRGSASAGRGWTFNAHCKPVTLDGALRLSAKMVTIWKSTIGGACAMLPPDKA